MRTILIGMLIVSLGGCVRYPPKIDRIEMRLTGFTDLDVTVNTNGQGRYEYREPAPESGTFAITPPQFDELLEGVESFRKLAKPVPSQPQLPDMQCPEGTNVMPGAGSISVRWIGPRIDELYFANLECNWKEEAARNAPLFASLQSLPIPGSSHTP